MKTRRYNDNDDDDDFDFDYEEEESTPRRTPSQLPRKPINGDDNDYEYDDNDAYEVERISSRGKDGVSYFDKQDEKNNSRPKENRHPNRRDVDGEQKSLWVEGDNVSPSMSNRRKGKSQDTDDYYYDEDDGQYQSSTASSREPEWNDRIEWEEIVVPSLYPEDTPRTTAHVLLPPAPPTMHPLPCAILHFVGGTFFGSAPNLWYAALLEEIVRHTQCAIVVTPLPVITPLNTKQSNRPLNHVQMAKQLQHQFQYAYKYVIQDAYYDNKKALQEVPIAGLGHSLGSRLLVVLATLMKDDTDNTTPTTDDDDDDEYSRRRGRGRRRPTLPKYQYKSLLLISFTNHGASAGIPGISSLLKQSRKVEQQQRAGGHDKRRRQYDGDDDDGQYQRSSARPSSRNRRRQNDWYNYDDEDEDEDDDDDIMEELGELWKEMQSVFQTQADRVKTVLTPASQDLEFHPTPQQLWKALEGGRYRIPQTLLVQFDRDDMDQSAELAAALLRQQQQATAGSTTSDVVNATAAGPRVTATVQAPAVTTEKNATNTDLKFARLRGTHLTPISATKGNSPSQTNRRNPGLLRELSSQSTKVLWKLLQGGRPPVGDVSPEVALRDLRQSITRYIADVVTK